MREISNNIMTVEVEGDMMFDIKMVTTDKNQRRSGLGTDLLRRSVQLAASLGYKVQLTV